MRILRGEMTFVTIAPLTNLEGSEIMSTPVAWTDAATASAAVIALLLSLYSLWFARLQRRDSLFRCRFNFYKRLSAAWVATHDGHDIDEVDLIPFAVEAEFIFGTDVSEYVMSLARRSHQGTPFFPDEDFVKPFRRYLTLDAPFLQRITWQIFGRPTA